MSTLPPLIFEFQVYPCFVYQGRIRWGGRRGPPRTQFLFYQFLSLPPPLGKSCTRPCLSGRFSHIFFHEKLATSVQFQCKTSTEPNLHSEEERDTEIVMQRDRATERQRYIDRKKAHRDRETVSVQNIYRNLTSTQRDRATERDRGIYTEGQRDGDNERQRDRETERQRERET